jgi:hypothetical protein
VKPGDLVRVKKVAIDKNSTAWFVRFAKTKVPMLVLEIMKSSGVAKCLRPDGTTCFIRPTALTKRF